MVGNQQGVSPVFEDEAAVVSEREEQEEAVVIGNEPGDVPREEASVEDHGAMEEE